MVQLAALHERVDRESPRSPLLRARFALLQSARPLVALANAARGVLAHGADVAKVTHVPRGRQLSTMWSAIRRHPGLTPDEFYRYRLFDPSHANDAPLYFTVRANMGVREHICRQLGLDTGRLADKRRFVQTCAEHGLPVPPTLVEFEEGTVRWWPAAVGGRLPEADLFSKRADRLCGEGAARWLFKADRRYHGDAGQQLTAEELVSNHVELSRTGAFILQKRLRNDPALAGLGPNALCTVRVVTCRHVDGAPEHLLSVFRMPSGSAAADNFAAGGLACPVDESTGELGVASRKRIVDAVRGPCFTHHPDTGAAIRGFHLPRWIEVIDLCLKAHRVFNEFPSVGWDVALADEGPVLLEGNYNWDVVLAQQPRAHPLGATRLPEYLLSFLERARTRSPLPSEAP